MELGDPIMAAGLPLNSGDLGILTVMIQDLGHQLRQTLGLGAVEVWIGHEASAARKRRQAKGADAGHSDGALGLCIRAQLPVVSQEKIFDVRHGSPAWPMVGQAANGFHLGPQATIHHVRRARPAPQAALGARGRLAGGRDDGVEQRVSLITLGVSDLGRARSFYEELVMRATFHQTAKRFLGAAEGFLLSDPLSTKVVAVLAGRIAAEAQPLSDDYLWATVEDDDGRVLGVAMHTPPRGLFVSRMPAGAAAVLAGALADAGRALPGVNGAVSATAPFAGAWAALTGQASTVVTAMRMYQLGELARPSGVPGRPAVAAAPADVALVASWFGAFHDEAQPHAPVEDWRALAARRVTAGEIHLWHDGGAPVALAAVSAAVTAEATAAALTGGAEHVTLYTDLANPTSNSIYQAIGYRPDHDAEERTFQ